jgi:hypothetical protein
VFGRPDGCYNAAAAKPHYHPRLDIPEFMAEVCVVQRKLLGREHIAEHLLLLVDERVGRVAPGTDAEQICGQTHSRDEGRLSSVVRAGEVGVTSHVEREAL